MTFIIRKPITNVGSSEINDGSIVNLDINASAAIDATKIHDGSVSNTEFGYLNGVTSSIQTQLNSKTSLTTATFTPNLFVTGGSGDTVPTYTDLFTGFYILGPNYAFVEYAAYNRSGGTSGSGSGRLSLELPGGISASSNYDESPFFLGLAYENSITFSNWDITCFVNSNDQELYLYKRTTDTSVGSTFTPSDQSGTVRGFRLSLWFRRA